MVSKKTKTSKEKRREKAESKSNNKGLIGAATMLSVVGMLNYMGQAEAPACTFLNEMESQQMPVDELRVARVSEAKSELSASDFE